MSKHSARPQEWVQVIRPDTEDCYWVEPNGTRHEATPEEIAEVRRELLKIRTISDHRRQQKIDQER